MDLNLLRVFDAVMRHRGVAAAARELELTPSAVSHALARLRRALGDDLFIAGEAGMEPTPAAMELAAEVHGGLTQLESVFRRRPFEPQLSTRTFRIAATDYTDTVYLPLLVERLLRASPRIGLRVFPANRVDVVGALAEGRLDIALGWFGSMTGDLRRQAIASDSEVLVAGPGHKLAGRLATVADVLRHPHLVVELTGIEQGLVNGFLNERGVLRRAWIETVLIQRPDLAASLAQVRVKVPHYAAVFPMLQRTDLVATLPRRLAAPALQRGELVEIRTATAPQTVDIEAVWHARASNDGGVQWLLGELRAVEATLSAEAASG